jgi:hypothetical protein
MTIRERATAAYEFIREHNWESSSMCIDSIERAIEAAVAEEREACAVAMEDSAWGSPDAIRHAAMVIRARGAK